MKIKFTDFIITLVVLTVLAAIGTYVLDYTNAMDFSEIWEGKRADLILPSSGTLAFGLAALKFFSGMFMNTQNANNEKVVQEVKEFKKILFEKLDRLHEADMVKFNGMVKSELVKLSQKEIAQAYIDKYTIPKEEEKPEGVEFKI